MYDCGRHGVNLTDASREKAYEIRRRPVIAINVDTLEEKYYPSQQDAAIALGLTQQHIWGVLNGYRRTTGGYRFEYVCQEEDD